MKKLLLIFSIFFCFQFQSKASHVVGGELSWECLSNGNFVFTATLYRDCSGITLNFESNFIEVLVSGSPLPRNINNNTIQRIILFPDSNLFNNNMGDISPVCGGTLSNFNCQNGDRGSYQKFVWKSNPITLVGTPPRSGWKFDLKNPCCRPGGPLNIFSSGSYFLRSIMYPNATNDPVNLCFDTSPNFNDEVDYIFCRGSMSFLDNSVSDNDLDSLVYRWQRIYNQGPSSTLIPLSYRLGYTFDNPTPDKYFNPLNEPSVLDINSGIINFKIFDRRNLLDPYYVALQVDAYRSGTLLSSTIRELILIIIDCPDLDTNIRNNAPIIQMNSSSNSRIFNIKAGDNISFPVFVSDNDSINGQPSFQTIELTPLGSQFSNNLINPSFCNNPPCATISYPNIIYDSTKLNYVIRSNSNINATLNWQTDCAHLNSEGKMKSYYFHLKAKDDFCPVPATSISTIQVNVFPSNPKAPTIECVEKIENVGNQIYWDTSGLGQNDFIAWGIFGKVGSSSIFRELSRINDYNVTSFLDTSSSSFNSAYQIKALKVGCNDTAYSLPSESVGALNDNIFIFLNELRSSELNANFQWYDCQADTLVTGETDRIFVPKDTGVFAVILTKGVCVDTSNCIAVFPVGINEIDLKGHLSIYPNPNNGLFNIESSLTEELQLRVFNIQGQLVQEEMLLNSKNQIQINGEDGLYFITISNQKGEQANFKVVKQ